MEITSLQYSIDAAYEFYMHVRRLRFIGSFLVDKIEWLIRFMEGKRPEEMELVDCSYGYCIARASGRAALVNGNEISIKWYKSDRAIPSFSFSRSRMRLYAYACSTVWDSKLSTGNLSSLR